MDNIEAIMNSQMACTMMNQARAAFNQVLAARLRANELPCLQGMQNDHQKIVKAILEGRFQSASDDLSTWVIRFTPNKHF